MTLTKTTIILVVLCSLFYYGVCRAPIIEPTLVKSIKKAIIRTKADNAKKFYGTRASISIFKQKVDESQWSASRMKLSNGPESIEAGLMVNPAVFNNYEAHLYAKFVVNGKECINPQCPGFVQVDKETVLGVVPDVYSQIHGLKYAWFISIEKHQDDGNWWLWISTTYPPTGEKTQIGYWPKSLFTSLAEVASQVEWGGEINNPWAKYPQPEMGSGIVAFHDTNISACLLNVTVVDQNYEHVLPRNTEKECDCPLYYNSLDVGYRGDQLGRLMFFGGPNGIP